VAQRDLYLLGITPLGIEDRRGAVDEGLAGCVAHEAPDQLLAYELRHSGMAGDAVEHIGAVLEIGLLGVQEHAEQELRPGVVPRLPIDEIAVVLGGILPMPVLDRPAGERRRGLVNIDIGVADRIVRVFGARRDIERIHEAQVVLRSERMQLQQFTRPVFVRPGTRIGYVVQEVEHRSALGDGN
jgi:hypothetical protein